MIVTSPRVFIVDFDLVGYSGHFFNQVFGFREAARELGLETRIYIRDTADPNVASELNARAILPFLSVYTSKDGILASFAAARRSLAQLWEELEGERISKHDILVFTSSYPQIIFGVCQWLGALPEIMRPAIFFRFFRTDFFDFRTMTFSKTAWAYRFLARMISETPGRDRLFFTVNNDRAVQHLDRLTLRPTFFLSVPKYYGPAIDRPHSGTEGPATIYVHVNRSRAMPELVSKVVNAVLQRRSDVTFAIRLCGYAFQHDSTQKSATRASFGPGVKILPGDQDQAGYLAAIEQADMILLPYDPVEYHDIVSGIFCETAAMGKIAIIPAGTWMADQIVEARATGVLFEKDSVADIVAAIERALQDRARLQAEARDRAGPFRDTHSCAGNLGRMLELSRQSHDMRLPYVPLTDVTEVMESYCYLGKGWNCIEDGYGVWSDGDCVELNISIKPDAGPLVFSAFVRPFLAGRPLKDRCRGDGERAACG